MDISIMQNKMISLMQYNHPLLMNLPNVNGIGVGFKRIKNMKTTELSIHVLVEKKVPNCCLSYNEIIPKNYNGFTTDVIETGKIFISPPNLSTNLKERKRPLEGGYSVGVDGKKNFTGTLGCIVTKIVAGKRKFYILSNNHVLAGENSIPKGSNIIQPSALDGGILARDKVAILSDFAKLRFKNAISTPVNYMDCAIAELTSSALATDKIATIGKVNGAGVPKLNSAVRKVGRTTNATIGVINTIGTQLKITFSKGQT
ncbi:MAG: hypothetical protein ACRC7R_00935, partial [Sarcina sp.]